MSADYAERYPVLTFASGPTNSMRGAAFLSGLKDAMVVDVGGTTTDVGALTHGFPREASVAVDIGGVRTNFRMPDVYSFGLGGGSLVKTDPLRIGPQSVGYRLTEEALVFGGETLTTTDIAVAAGVAEIGDARARSHDLDSGPRRGRDGAHPGDGGDGGGPHEDERGADPGHRGRGRQHSDCQADRRRVGDGQADRTSRRPTPSAPRSRRSPARSTASTRWKAVPAPTPWKMPRRRPARKRSLPAPIRRRCRSSTSKTCP